MARSSDSFFLIAVFRDQTFQMRQIRRVMLLAGVFVLLSTLVLGAFYHYILGELVAGTSPMLFASEEMQRLNSQIPGLTSVLGRWIIVMLVVNVLLTVVVAIYIMRQLGSPLLAIRRVLNEIADGNLAVQLRRNDTEEFGEIVDALNGAVACIQEKIGDAQQNADAIDLDNSDKEQDLEESRQALANCRQALDYFTIAPSANAGHPESGINDSDTGYDNDAGSPVEANG